MAHLINAEKEGTASAAQVLRGGGLVAFPTETVYGLGADAMNDDAVAKIFAAKGRPGFNPLIVHVADVAAARAIARFSPMAELLAKAFWPGPLTLVLPVLPGAGLSERVTSGLNTVGIRVPAHPVARALLEQFGGAVAAPSANPSGRISPTTAQHVMNGLGGRVDLIVDGGACAVGVESSIVGFDPGPVLLRPGGVTKAQIEMALGGPVGMASPDGPVTAPGQLLSHYAPAGPVRLNATAPEPGEFMIGFGPVPGDVTLSPSGRLAEAAANLFAALHLADQRGAERIAVAPIPAHGLGRAINDRLGRAAAPRP